MSNYFLRNSSAVNHQTPVGSRNTPMLLPANQQQPMKNLTMVDKRLDPKTNEVIFKFNDGSEKRMPRMDYENKMRGKRSINSGKKNHFFIFITIFFLFFYFLKGWKIPSLPKNQIWMIP